MMIVVRRLNENEPDILAGSERQKLVITTLNDDVLLIVEAAKEWTVELLESMEAVAHSTAENYQESGWNAYLGGKWIGSSEV